MANLGELGSSAVVPPVRRATPLQASKCLYLTSQVKHAVGLAGISWLPVESHARLRLAPLAPTPRPSRSNSSAAEVSGARGLGLVWNGGIHWHIRVRIENASQSHLVYEVYPHRVAAFCHLRKKSPE